MFESMTERLKRVIAQAHREALLRGEAEVGPGHLLVALLLVRLGNGFRALKNERLTVPRLRYAMASVVGPGTGKVKDGRTSFSAAALAVLEATQALACDLDMDDVDTPHLLVALLDVKDGVPSRMLEVLAVPADRVRRATFRILQHQGSLSGASLDFDLRHILSSPEGPAIEALLDRARRAHREAYRSADWEQSARIAGAVSEISFVLRTGMSDDWVAYARERLAAVLPAEKDDLPDCWPPEPEP